MLVLAVVADPLAEQTLACPYAYLVHGDFVPLRPRLFRSTQHMPQRLLEGRLLEGVAGG